MFLPKYYEIHRQTAYLVKNYFVHYFFIKIVCSTKLCQILQPHNKYKRNE